MELVIKIVKLYFVVDRNMICASSLNQSNIVQMQHTPNPEGGRGMGLPLYPLRVPTMRMEEEELKLFF